MLRLLYSNNQLSTGRLSGRSFSKEKLENSKLNKETREIRVFLISSYFSLKILSDVFLNFSTLTVKIGNFRPQIRILRVEILLGHISACLKTSILKFRLLLIYSYFSLKIWSDVFECFCLLFWSRSCLESSGRLLGTISTKSRPNPIPGVRVISC